MNQHISRRQALKYGTALPLLLSNPNISLAKKKSDSRPNIVLIMADDLGYGDLGSYGCPDIQTPSIDNLAQRGVRFTQYYANAPECTPTRTALLTGRYQQRVGGLECAIGTGNVGRYDDAIRLRGKNQLGLPTSETTIAKRLKGVGYSTAITGKWHLGYDAKFNPLDHGFDYFFGSLGGGVDYFHHTEWDGGHFFARNRESIKPEGYMTDLISDESVGYIGRQTKEKPFFLYVPYTAPHSPYHGPNDSHQQPKNEDDWNVGSRETYAKMVESMDKGIGRILDELKKQGFSDNTLIIFCSDNGGAKYANNGFLSKGKGTCFEGGIRVPCIISWPGRITYGAISHQTAITMDLTASIARIGGIKHVGGKPFDGIDIIKEIEMNRGEFKRTLFWRKRRGERTWRAVRDGNMKYISDQNGAQTTEYLFDLSNDPEEKTNLLAHSKTKVWGLKSLLKSWEAEVKPAR